MTVLTIRDIPDEVHGALHARAFHNGRSDEVEVCAILSETLFPAEPIDLS